MAGLINTGRDSLRLPASLARIMASVVDRTMGAVGDQLKNVQLLAEGVEHLPESGPGIIASRHGGVWDARVLNLASPRALTTVEVPRRLSGELAGQPTHRHWATLADRLLKNDELVLVFPEGRRSPDALVHKGQVGLGELVLRAQQNHPDIAIVPATVSLNGLGARVRFGPSLNFQRFMGLPIDRTLARGVTDAVISAIVELSEVPYGDSYSSTARGLQRDRAKEELRRRKREAAAQRAAEQAAVQAHRREVAEEVDDLDQRAASAADQAKRHARLASQRDAQRSAEVD